MIVPDWCHREIPDAAVASRLRALLAEAAKSGVEHNDPRLDYVVVQIDRAVWAQIQAETTP